MHCYAGCRTKDVLAAAGLTWNDLFATSRELHRPMPFRSPLAEARADVLREARRQRDRLVLLRDDFTIADEIRRRLHRVDDARRLATASGDMPAAWDALVAAAALERSAYELELVLNA